MDRGENGRRVRVGALVSERLEVGAKLLVLGRRRRDFYSDLLSRPFRGHVIAPSPRWIPDGADASGAGVHGAGAGCARLRAVVSFLLLPPAIQQKWLAAARVPRQVDNRRKVKQGEPMGLAPDRH